MIIRGGVKESMTESIVFHRNQTITFQNPWFCNDFCSTPCQNQCFKTIKGTPARIHSFSIDFKGIHDSIIDFYSHPAHPELLDPPRVRMPSMAKRPDGSKKERPKAAERSVLLIEGGRGKQTHRHVFLLIPLQGFMATTVVI